MSVPYIFTPGTVISSAQVNANFAAVGSGGMGVTDGSMAGAGQVGEYQYIQGNSAANGLYLTHTDTSPKQLGALPLTAGDWDVTVDIGAYSGGATAGASGASMAGSIGFTLTSNPAQTDLFGLSNVGLQVASFQGGTNIPTEVGNYSATLGPTLMNHNAAFTAYLLGQISAPYGTGNLYQVYWTIRARRMR